MFRVIGASFIFVLMLAGSLPFVGQKLHAAEPMAAADIIKALKKKGTTRGATLDQAARTDASTLRRRQLIATLKGKMKRGLSIDEEERVELAEIVITQPSIDMDIPFEFNSAEISSLAMPSLTELGKALASDDLKRMTFVVAGHTDHKGAKDYNQSLSEKRALAIRDFLAQHHGVELEQMITLGYGEQQPKEPSDPYSPVNRRVQIVNLDED